jgi:signal transduction histidine kinase
MDTAACAAPLATMGRRWTLILFVNTMNRVNILGEALDGLGRWYVAVPPFLIVGFLVALFFLVGAGQSRLQHASERLQVSASRERAIDDLEGEINKAQSGLRGYLLTDDKIYLRPYTEAIADIEPRLEHLRLEYAGSGLTNGNIRALQGLIGKRISELGVTLALHNGPDPSRSIAFIRTNVGEKTSASIADIIGGMRERESLEQSAALANWDSSLRLSRWFTATATIFSMLLVGLAARLVYLDLRRRTLQTAELRDQKLLLEREVEERTRALVELSTHLQNVAEREKAKLARELHDELGALLVSARMDISRVEQNLKWDDADMRQRLARVQRNLAAGVDLKRRIIEELRPTLLDNVGMFAALRWQMKETCRSAGLKCTEAYPAEEPKFTAEASIALYRVAQEALTNIVKHSGAQAVDIALEIDAEEILLRIADDGRGIPASRLSAAGSHGMASMRHRVRALGGSFSVSSPASGGTLIMLRVPKANALAPGQAA